ncbi:DoxX family protein [Temperatibacter marinus]|uniref:DoxX family protein n=1 Tax=Temperatibacter marinus TaxID=1456591 RepID=A0AA52EGK8_9PROT|nr:DoxX family protein [Temperatibacter marinus]WND01691.1 DoxX family protein [Temperatibacter marinus]
MVEFYNSLVRKLESLPAPDINLIARLWIAYIFWKSGRTKVDEGFLEPSETTYLLFENEYALPLLPYDLAAHMAIYAETFLPLLLIAGFMTRVSATMLLGMTAVIQIFVYPTSWPDHLMWAVVLVFLVLRGGGAISLDRITIEKKTVKAV